MKKFFIFIVLIGGGVAAWWFYDPYLESYLGPVVEKAKEKYAELTAKPEKAPAPAVPAAEEPKPEKSAPEPSKPAPKPAPKPADPVAAAPEKTDIDKLVEERYPAPEILPLTQIVDNWQNVPLRAYPDQVALQDNLSFQLKGPGGEVIGASVAAPGTLVKPVRLDGDTLTVESLANATMRNQIPVDKTDFKQRIQSRYDEFVRKTHDRIQRQREMARTMLLAKAAEDPGAVSVAAGSNAPADDSNDPRFEPVKASLAAGEVKAANLDEAVAYRWNGPERIDGDTYRGLYDTVTVKFEVKTIFGSFPNEFKCLLRKGKVEGWIDPLTMEEKI